MHESRQFYEHSDPENEVIDLDAESEGTEVDPLDGPDEGSASSSSEEENDLEAKKEAFYPSIASLCQALGGYEQVLNEETGVVESVYQLGDRVISHLKDLKRFWRLDEKDDDRSIARILFDIGVFKNDLVPILLKCVGTEGKSNRIALACVELIGAMTWPVNPYVELTDLKERGSLKGAKDYTIIQHAQLSYKSCILRTNVIQAMFSLMMPSLEKRKRERTERDEAVVALVLNVIRNLALIKDKPQVGASLSADAYEFASLQSDFILQLQEENVFELLIAMASSADSSEFSPWTFTVLDIFYIIFKGVKPSELIIPPEQMEESRLEDLLLQESSIKRTKARTVNSRHSRFGTTVSLQAGDKRYILHKQSVVSVGAERTLDSVKKKKHKNWRTKKEEALDSVVWLKPNALECLSKTAKLFIDSAFNTFFENVIRDIRGERVQVKESDSLRFLILGRFFVEFFILLYDQQAENAQILGEEHAEKRDFYLITGILENSTLGWLLNRMKGFISERPIPWTELNACIQFFTQSLLLVEKMENSGNQDYKHNAELLQSKLFYDVDTLDMVFDVVAQYKNQSVGYLEATINLTYVLLRMLEQYSKKVKNAYVSKKVKKRKNKKKDQGEDEGDEDVDEEKEEAEAQEYSSVDRAFIFADYEQKFASERVLDTCMAYLERYKEFTSGDQIKRIVTLLHRQAVKAKSEALFFKPTVLELFRRIMSDPYVSKSRTSDFGDLKKLISYILRQFFKRIAENPFLGVEIFFPKSKSILEKMREGKNEAYLDSSEDDSFETYLSKSREVEIDPGLELCLTDQLGVAIACLVGDNKENLVKILIKNLESASAARKAKIEAITGGSEFNLIDEYLSDDALRERTMKGRGAATDHSARFTPHQISWETEEQKKAAYQVLEFKLLMRLLGWLSQASDQELEWSIPTSIHPTKLDADKRILEDFLIDPIDIGDKRATDYLKFKRKSRAKKHVKVFEDDQSHEDSSGDVKRKRVAKTVRNRVKRVAPGGFEELADSEDESPGQRRRQKKVAEETTYKSAQFIHSDDDDEDGDRAFFERERQLRAQGAGSAGYMLVVHANKPEKATRGKKKNSGQKQAKTSRSKPKKRNGKLLEPQRQSDPVDVEMVSDIESNGGQNPVFENDSDAPGPLEGGLVNDQSRKRSTSFIAQSISKRSKTIVFDSDDE